MNCLHPLLGVPSEYTSRGDPVKGCKFNVIGKYSAEVAKDYPGAIKIPCGKCKKCRLNKAREWADRMIIELDHSKDAVFLTLTYDNDHVPAFMNLGTGEVNLTLQKRDLQNFFKRLRKQFPDKELRYYAVGEYG